MISAHGVPTSTSSGSAALLPRTCRRLTMSPNRYSPMRSTSASARATAPTMTGISTVSATSVTSSSSPTTWLPNRYLLRSDGGVYWGGGV